VRIPPGTFNELLFGSAVLFSVRVRLRNGCKKPAMCILSYLRKSEERMFTHTQIWGAIDDLAHDHALSPSGLAKKAGLDSTSLNKCSWSPPLAIDGVNSENFAGDRRTGSQVCKKDIFSKGLEGMI
jgi:hypothetical protein